MVVENEEMGQKIIYVSTELPQLKMIITWTGEIRNTNSRMITWKELMKIGKDLGHDSNIYERHKKMSINECCLLIYTSGTTGNPKGIFSFVKHQFYPSF